MRTKLLLAVCVLLLCAGVVWAGPSPTPTPDTSSFLHYTALANQGKTEVVTATDAIGRVVTAIVIGLVGFCELIKWIKKSVQNKADFEQDLADLGLTRKQYRQRQRDMKDGWVFDPVTGRATLGGGK